MDIRALRGSVTRKQTLRIEAVAGISGGRPGCWGLKVAQRRGAILMAGLIRRQVLVVDDDPGIQETLRDLLEEEGYEVVVAGNGRQALDRLDQGLHPDIILLDLMMPVMNGWQFREHLRQRGEALRPPIVVISADHTLAAQAAQLQAEGYLAKPFDLMALLAEVARYTARATEKV